MKAGLRKGWCPGALRPMEAQDGLLVRLRPTGGILPATTAIAIADLAERYGNGLFDLTARANLQMRGVSATMLPPLQDGLYTLGLLDSDAEAEAVRNVIASPLAGLHGGIDIRPLVAALERRLAGEEALHALPAKFLFLVDDGSRPSLADIDADVRFDWDGEGFVIGLGGTAKDTIHIGKCDGASLSDEAARTANAFLQASAGRTDVRRMRDLNAVLGADDLATIFARIPSPVCGRTRALREQGSDEGSHHAQQSARVGQRNIVGLRTLEVPCLGLAAPFGRLDATMLRSVARVADSTETGELRLTPWRVILIPGADAVALPGFITDSADPRLAVAACVGAPGCARATTDTHADATALSTALPPDAGISLHVSGCEKGCAKASATVATLVARDGRYDLVRNGRAGDTPALRGLDLEAARRALVAELEPV